MKWTVGFVTIGILGLTACGQAVTPRTYNETPLQNNHAEVVAYNRWVTSQRLDTFDLPPASHPNVIRPYAEYERAGVVVYSSAFDFNSVAAKRLIAQFLPQDVSLLVLGGSFESPSTIQSQLGVQLPASRFQVHLTGDPGIHSGGFWFRDSGPIALIGKDSSGVAPVRAVMDNRHWTGFEPDTWFAPVIHALRIVPAAEWNYQFEGGNFMADSRGNCFTIDKGIPEAYFTHYFGCKTVTVLPCIKGICHIDESAKLVSDTDVLTDLDEYAQIFAAKGYKVHRLPQPTGVQYATYVNSLLVNGTVYVPVYGLSTDTEALSVYSKFGFRVLSADSTYLSEYGSGSIHCITQTYPAL